MEQPKYHIDIFWSDEDDGYIANVPDLRYCSAFGESYEEALREVLVAMELHLDTLRELDRPIPEPEGHRLSKRFFEDWVETLQDQTGLRMSPSFKELLEKKRRIFQENSQEAISQEAIETYIHSLEVAYIGYLNSMFEEHRSKREQTQRRARN